MSEAQINEILKDFARGHIKHIHWEEQTTLGRRDELKKVMDSAKEALHDWMGRYGRIIPRGDAGRIVFSARGVELPVFAFAHSAQVIGGIRYDFLGKPDNVYARVKAALWYEINIRDELPDESILFSQIVSLGGLVVSAMDQSVPMMVLSTACCLVASLAMPIITERNAMARIAVNRDFHRDIASYLYNVAAYEAQCGHRWQAFKASCAHSAFMRLPVSQH